MKYENFYFKFNVQIIQIYYAILDFSRFFLIMFSYALQSKQKKYQLYIIGKKIGLIENEESEDDKKENAALYEEDDK